MFAYQDVLPFVENFCSGISQTKMVFDLFLSGFGLFLAIIQWKTPGWVVGKLGFTVFVFFMIVFLPPDCGGLNDKGALIWAGEKYVLLVLGVILSTLGGGDWRPRAAGLALTGYVFLRAAYQFPVLAQHIDAQYAAIRDALGPAVGPFLQLALVLFGFWVIGKGLTRGR